MANFDSSLVDIIIPTFNNESVLFGCVSTVLAYTLTPYKAFIVNNGRPLTMQINSPLFEVHNTGKNLGWMGGINYGAKQGTSKYILLLNDDTQILDHQSGWLNKMINVMEKNPEVGVVVPTSNCVMHLQSMFVQGLPMRFSAGMVSGFCLLIRREIFERLGGLDESLYGGDDIDLSIRVRDLGYKLIVMRDVFVYHHGYMTGKAVFGSHWNSPEYSDRVNAELIKKHGFKKWVNTATSGVLEIECGQRQEDFETQAIMSFLDPALKTLDVGCGSRKIMPEATGVDLVPRGTTSYNPTQINFRSQADVNCDFSSLPFDDNTFDRVVSRHTLEHITDLIATLREWKRVLKKDGVMVIAVPDEDVCPGIPLDPTHLHAFTKDSMASLVGAVGGLEIIFNETPKACYSFTTAIRKVA